MATLTDRAIKEAKPQPKPYKLFDGQGMYLLITPEGGKYWRLKYRRDGKEKLLALGVYPDTSLKRARSKLAEAKDKLEAGVDPSEARKIEKQTNRLNAGNTFESVAREWYAKQTADWSETHAETVMHRLENRLFKFIGARPIAEIDAAAMLEVLGKIEAEGHFEALNKTRVIAGQVFRYAVVTRRALSDPTRDLKGAFESREPKNYARLKEDELPEFLKKLEAYDGLTLTKLAIRLLMLTFVRTGELRFARWPEFNFEKREWRIPAERTKNGVEHIVPLSTQAMECLRQLQTITGDEDFVFPNEHNALKPMSENTILFALYRMGYRGRATGHGFRATASTILNEQGWDADVIERQLAHKESNKVRAAYHHAQYLPERKKLMQHWADFLDAKRADGENVVSLNRKRA